MQRINSENQSSAGENAAAYYFHQGTNYRAYDYMGVHAEQLDGTWRYTFRVWAYRADAVEVAGDFNGWGALPMTRITDGGIWEAVLCTEASLCGARYKYRVISPAGTHLKADPYAREGEWGMQTASVIPDDTPFAWGDAAWMQARKSPFSSPDSFYPAPMHIYEMHLGSWMTRNGESTADNGGAYLNYREIADELVSYLRQMHYTHVEFMPITEFPYDGSWGYQCCGYFSPTSRFGSPADLRYLIDSLHKNNIGVILDWVPAHFPKDEHGLYAFDGYPMYEYQGWDRMENEGWGTRYFDVGRNEVQSFLVSSALYWLREYHVDGLRTDAVASMLYLDYDRRPGEWVPNAYGGNQNLEAVAFFQKLNGTVFGEFPDVLMIAEESTAWGKVTHPVSDGGLGFNFKWNMGWANDIYDYVATDPFFRKYKHEKLTFSMMYAFDENYILPVSHDEVVHGKKSLLDKMFGSYEEKFAALRTFFAFQMTHPGKKMTFMGSEYGQFREWDYENQLEWFMTDYEMHRKTQHFVAALNRFYLETPALWEIDDSWEGFRWINPDDRDNNVISFRRFDRRGGELVVVLNFGPVERPGYALYLTDGKPYYTPVFSTDESRFGGGGRVVPSRIEAEREGDGRKLIVDLPPYSALLLIPGISSVTLPSAENGI